MDGAGSALHNGRDLRVGYEGDGRLNITGGGTVTVGWDTWVAVNSGSSGTIHLDNGTLTTGGLLCASDDLSGTGTINTHGLVSDVDLVFDATQGLNQTFSINNNPGQDITINLDVDGSGTMGAGYDGTGMMGISDGIIIESTYGYIGYKSGSTGEVTVEGAGSAWINSRDLYIGGSEYSGGANGILNVINGAEVRSEKAYVGDKVGSTGEVTVEGNGSTWTTNYEVVVGNSGSGELNVTDGGRARHSLLYIGEKSGSIGKITADGTGSWMESWCLYVGNSGVGTLDITGGGLASVSGNFTIDYNGDGDSFVNMSTGGMLALKRQADGSLAEFLEMVIGTDAIRYWDDSISDWADITGAAYGRDYTLNYLTEGDLAGYTVLTVGVVPEPSIATLLVVGAVALLAYARRKRR